MSNDPLWIQRHEHYWTGDDMQMRPSDSGEYVRYTDHCEVVDIAIARASQAAYRTGVAEARAAVDRAYWRDSPSVQRGTAHGVTLALAAIDGLTTTAGTTTDGSEREVCDCGAIRKVRKGDRRADIARLLTGLAEAKALLASRDEAYEQGRADAAADVAALRGWSVDSFGPVVGPPTEWVAKDSAVAAALGGTA